MRKFVTWCKEKHKYSKINFITLAQRYAGKDEETLSNRKAVLEAARKRKPLRWTKGVLNCDPSGSVLLNPNDVNVKKAKAA